MSQGITDITVSNCRDLKREKTKINSHQVNSRIFVVLGYNFVNACYKSLLEVLYKNSAAKTQPISPGLANCRVYSLRWKLDHSITRGPTDLWTHLLSWHYTRRLIYSGVKVLLAHMTLMDYK